MNTFIVGWLLGPRNTGGRLGTEWGVGFRGQEYDNVRGFHQVMTCKFSFGPPGKKVGISPTANGTTYSGPFGTTKDLGFCGYYWWNGKWFGGFIDWWPVTGGRTSRGLDNADGQFEKAVAAGIKKFAFCITDMHSKRTNIAEITL